MYNLTINVLATLLLVLYTPIKVGADDWTARHYNPILSISAETIYYVFYTILLFFMTRLSLSKRQIIFFLTLNILLCYVFSLFPSYPRLFFINITFYVIKLICELKKEV